MSAVDLLAAHREDGVDLLLHDFVPATPDTRASVLARWEKWYTKLLTLTAPLGIGGQFKPLTPMGPEEQMTVAGCLPLDTHFNIRRVCCAVCLYRLGKAFQRLPLTPPRRESGRRYIDDHEVFQALLDELGEQSQRHEKENITKAANKVIDAVDFSQLPDDDNPAKMLDRLKYRLRKHRKSVENNSPLL